MKSWYHQLLSLRNQNGETDKHSSKKWKCEKKKAKNNRITSLTSTSGKVLEELFDFFKKPREEHKNE